MLFVDSDINYPLMEPVVTTNHRWRALRNTLSSKIAMSPTNKTIACHAPGTGMRGTAQNVPNADICLLSQPKAVIRVSSVLVEKGTLTPFFRVASAQVKCSLGLLCVGSAVGQRFRRRATWKVRPEESSGLQSIGHWRLIPSTWMVSGW